MNDIVLNGIMVAAVVLAILILFRRRGPVDQELSAGGLYSTDSGDGSFGIVKVLVEDPSTVHLRLYQNRFTQRPESVDPATLTLGGIDDEDSGIGIGIGHLPLARRDFLNWRPMLLMKQSVSDDELEGYQMWKEAGGGVFGGQS
ncbi:MAG: hypothetical protein ACO1SX_28195 [Actinomycetota bacterium]